MAPSEGSVLLESIGTEGEFHVEHEEEENSKGPHIDLKAIYMVFISPKYFRTHILLCSKDSPSYVRALLAEAKVS